MKKSTRWRTLAEIIAVVLSVVIFWIPFYFVIINSFKNDVEAAELNIHLPTVWNIFDNYKTVITIEDFMVFRAFLNSGVITVFALAILVVVCSMTGYVLQRRSGAKGVSAANFLILTGLIVPPAIVPTLWILMGTHLFKTLLSMILVETALCIPFCTILFRGYMSTIPKELDEAAYVDGCGKVRIFFQIILPLLTPVISTVIVLQAVTIFNDFVNPLYFLPGSKNVTVQLTLYNFISRFDTNWNYLFADVILISIPPLILFIFFNKKIIAGMTAGAVKG